MKYLLEGQVKEIIEDQTMARQCMVAVISHQPSAKPLAFTRRGL